MTEIVPGLLPDYHERNRLDIDNQLYKIQDMIRQLDSLNEKCTQNMNRLNAMMLELKGIVAMVRPKVKKTGWYGEEISVIPEEKEDPRQLYLDLSKGVEFKPEE